MPSIVCAWMHVNLNKYTQISIFKLWSSAPPKCTLLPPSYIQRWGKNKPVSRTNNWLSKEYQYFVLPWIEFEALFHFTKHVAINETVQQRPLLIPTCMLIGHSQNPPTVSGLLRVHDFTVLGWCSLRPQELGVTSPPC